MPYAPHATARSLPLSSRPEDVTCCPYDLRIMTSRILLSSVAISLIAVLAGCTPTPAAPLDPDETFVSATGDPIEPVPTLPPLEAGTVLIVRATATAGNGAQLDLEYRIQKSVPFDDIAAQTLPQAMIEDCPAAYTQQVFADNLWSFTRGNVIAIPSAGSTADWPTDAPIELLPSASSVAMSARGFIGDDADAAAETPPCQREKSFTGYGQGGVAIGIAGDTDAVGASGGFTRWANHSYGFVVADGITLSGCTFEVTELGAQYNGGAEWWTESNDTTSCVTGASPEAQEY